MPGMLLSGLAAPSAVCLATIACPSAMRSGALRGISIRIVCVLPVFVLFWLPRHPAFEPGSTTLKPLARALQSKSEGPDYTDFAKKLIFSAKTGDFVLFQGFPGVPEMF